MNFFMAEGVVLAGTAAFYQAAPEKATRLRAGAAMV